VPRSVPSHYAWGHFSPLLFLDSSMCRLAARPRYALMVRKYRRRNTCVPHELVCEDPYMGTVLNREKAAFENKTASRSVADTTHRA